MINAPSVIVLLVVAALLFLALRSIFKRGKGGACSCCSAQGCSGPKRGRSCCPAQRVPADADSQFDHARHE